MEQKHIRKIKMNFVNTLEAIEEVKNVKNVNRKLPKNLGPIEDIKQTEKELKAELKAIAKKVATSKQMKKEAASDAWKAKMKAKRTEMKAAKALENKPIVETMLVPVKKSDAQNMVAACANHVDSIVSDVYCFLKVIRDNGVTLKVLRKDNVWYLVSQYENVFGTQTDIISEHDDSGLASRALAKRLHDLACP
jgi:seryl-tRNA synthetase